MAEGLKLNHTILGIHMVGNNFDTDPKGFIRPNADSNFSTAIIMTKILPRLETGVVS